MSISYHIDPHRRVVFAAGHGTFNDRDVFAYQHDVWSRPELAGYDELIDMRDVERIDPPSSRRIQDLAAASAQMDSPAVPSRLAIVASDDLAFGLGRMYEVHRELAAGSTRKVSVFRSLEEAIVWLGLEEGNAATDEKPLRLTAE